MMPALAWIVSALTQFFGFVVKHPFVLKMMIFGFFVLAIHRFLGFMMGFVSPYLSSNTLLNLACYLGVIAAIKLYFSIVVAGFGAKQVLGFMKTT